MTMDDTTNEFSLKDAPNDLISAVKFSPRNNSLLLASSWDATVRLYNVANNHRSAIFRQHTCPVLDCCFQDEEYGWSGDLTGNLKQLNFVSYSVKDMGTHDMAIKCVEYCPSMQLVITGSWDKNVKLWDRRNFECVGTFAMPDRVYTMTLCNETLIVGTAGRRVLVYDLKNMSVCEQRRESSLKYQTRCIRCFPNEQGYVLSSIEGRVAVEYLDPRSEIQKKKYAFKCHRVKDDNGVELIYPVNAIAFHSGYNTFATGGSDGFVNIWDGFNKKRLCQLHRYPSHISALSFSKDGTYLAVASSFIYEAEKKEHHADEIFIRTVTDQETKPK